MKHTRLFLFLLALPLLPMQASHNDGNNCKCNKAKCEQKDVCNDTCKKSCNDTTFIPTVIPVVDDGPQL